LNGLVVRDPLAELLGRALIANATACDGIYAECFGQTLVMHVARLGETWRRAINALPKWRLKRVHDFVSAHLDECISLSDLAKAAGLSRMHFAAQFRAATGCRPHDYVLQRRIDRAKEILSSTDLPLAEVALATGFQEQSYFSTVFKRLTDETPARWKRACGARQNPSAAFGSLAA
jgi:transcriptional regulator GlxA family with amidase domain